MTMTGSFQKSFMILVLATAAVPLAAESMEASGYSTHAIKCLSAHVNSVDEFVSSSVPRENIVWSPVTFPSRPNGAGYFWYECEFDLTSRPDQIFVILEGARGADETYINGRLLGQTGPMRGDNFPDWKSLRAYPVPNALILPGLNTFSVKMRPLEWTAALKRAPQIRDGRDATAVLRAGSRAAYPEMVLGAVFLFVGLYFYYLWWHFRDAHDNLFFALYCTDLAAYLWVRSAVPFFFGYNWFTLGLEYATLFFTAPLFCRFLFPFLRLPSPRTLYIYEVVTGSAVLYMALVPDIEHWWRILQIFRITLLGAVVWAVWLIGRALFRGHEEARYMALAFAIFFVSVVADIFSSVGLLRAPSVVSYGFVIFLLGIAFILANRYVRLFRERKNRSALLRDLDRRKTEFLANISHELKTPLAVVVLCAESLAENLIEGPEPVERALVEMETNAARLQQIVSDAVLLNLIETGHFIPRMEKCALGDVIHGAVSELHQLVEKRGIVVEAKIPDNLSVDSDPVLLGRIMDHVIENAVLYNRDGGRLTVEARQLDDAVEIAVSDQGSGVPADVKMKLFQKFVRGDTSSTYAVQGTGTGLALAAAAASVIGGSLHLVRSTPAGSMFSVRFADVGAGHV